MLADTVGQLVNGEAVWLGREDYVMMMDEVNYLIVWGGGIKFGCYANVRELCGMKQCLNCHKEFEYKRESAKFCSDKCRATYNRKYPKQSVSPIQMQVLYNAFLDAVEKIQYSAPKQVYDASKSAPTIQDEPFKYVKPIPKVAVDAIMRKYVDDRRDCSCDEEYISWLERLENDERLTSKQRELVKNTH